MEILRLLKIVRTIGKYRLDKFLPGNTRLPFFLRTLLLPFKAGPASKYPEAVNLRMALEELGPIFIKFGQLLSTRRDLFEDDVSDELQKLQDQVPPFEGALAKKIAQASLGSSLDELFLSFDEVPLASASVAQVHAAQLLDGTEVVVKIVRPKIESTIKKDLKLMYLLASMIEKFSVDAKRLHPVQVVHDYETTIINELNLQLEASNASQLGRNWNSSGKLYVPEIHWDFTRSNILVMERVYGPMVSEIEKLKEKNTDLKKLAHLGVEIFFTQVFEDNFFHADMHPGNVFINISDPSNPTYIALDCAIIGKLSEADKLYLAQNLLAFFKRDYGQVARLHLDSGWVPPDTNLSEFESVIRAVCEPIFQKPIKEISFGQVLVSLFQTARKFNMEIQPQLVLLQKTLINIEGLGRQLYPDLDLWETAAPFMETWMKNRSSPARLFKELSTKLPLWLDRLPELPEMAFEAMTEMRQIGSYSRTQSRMLDELKIELARQNRFTRRLGMGGITVLAALMVILVSQASQINLNELILGSSILGGIGAYWLVLKP